MIKVHVNGTEKDITRVAMPVNDVDKGWEVRAQDGTILWGADKTITSGPKIDFKGYGLPLKTYTIKGNMTRPGTPSPTDPVPLIGSGIKTNNLFNKDARYTANGYLDNKYLKNDGSENAGSTYAISEYIVVDAETDYILCPSGNTASTPAICFYDSQKGFISAISYNQRTTIKFQTPINTKYIRFTVVKVGMDETTLYAGTQETPFEPYGYKLVITNAGVNYNVFIRNQLYMFGDNVDAVTNGKELRNVGVFVLNGSEAWRQIDPASGGAVSFRLNIGDYQSVIDGSTNVNSTHFVQATVSTTTTAVGVQILNSPSANAALMNIRNGISTTLSEFKAWLLDQFMNGTPVIVVYKYATTQETTIQTPEITTTVGNNTISVLTNNISPISTFVNESTAEENPDPGNAVFRLVDYINNTQNAYTPLVPPNEIGHKRCVLYANGNGTNIRLFRRTKDSSIAITRIDETFSGPVSASIDVLSNDPTTVGGIRLKNIIISEGVIPSELSITGHIKPLTLSTITGIPPITFTADGTPLISLSMEGNTAQTGTPTPDNIIMPDFCGKLIGTDWTIPITCGGVTNTVYLGQTPTVRWVKKLVLTGSETFINKSRPDADEYMYSLRFDHEKTKCFCSHLQHTATFPRTVVGIYSISYAYIYMCIGPDLQNAQPSGNTVDGFKEYLAAQYAAGTPVTIWYVLAEPETGTVNEPLAKIEDYADELSSTDAGVTIPTVEGQNTLTVDTTLPPSEMSIICNIKLIS